MALFAALRSGGDLYDWIQGISYRSNGRHGLAPVYWACVYLYGIPYSILAQALIRRFVRRGRVIWLSLIYPLGGYLFFAALGVMNAGLTDWIVGTVIAGTVAAVVAALFYCGTLIGASRTYAALGLGIVLPALLATAATLAPPGGFARGWTVSTPSADETIAAFDYLNGERPMPAYRLEAGQRARYELEFDVAAAKFGGGGYGMRVEGPADGWTSAPLDQGRGGVIETDVEGEYRVFIYGDRTYGTVRLRWSVEEADSD
ncbi:hypothetical protein MO973_02575 [Paenibacillus sp. TRM 82003]|nr:hypothetical protein [Paenibacillus sp. TRM 82003]